MFPTVARLSKASRRPLTPKRGNKDYYKGTRQAFLPGGLRTGAPGKHVVGGKAKYRLIDEKVRVFVAPPLEKIVSSPLKPYVGIGVRLTQSESRGVFGRFPGPRGLTPEYFLKVARRHAGWDVELKPSAPGRRELEVLPPPAKEAGKRVGVAGAGSSSSGVGVEAERVVERENIRV